MSSSCLCVCVLAKEQKCHCQMKIGSISVALCRLGAGAPLICSYSRSLISLAASLVLSPAPHHPGQKMTPWWTDGEQMNKQTAVLLDLL